MEVKIPGEGYFGRFPKNFHRYTEKTVCASEQENAMPPDRVYLLADMHLKPLDAPDAEARSLAEREYEQLAAFLEYIEGKAAALVLLGDAFNFWLERKSRVVGDYSVPLALFKAAADNGLVIHHVSGNRDFVVGEGLGFDPLTRYPGFIKYRGGFTVSRLVDYGIEVHGPKYRFHQGGKTIACLHGDALCTGDFLFMLLRWGLQGPVGRMFFKYAPWFVLEHLVRGQQTRTKPRTKILRFEALFRPDAVRRELAMGADQLISAHIHREYAQSFTVADRECRLVSLPAWLDGGYGVLENGELTVRQFQI